MTIGLIVIKTPMTITPIAIPMSILLSKKLLLLSSNWNLGCHCSWRFGSGSGSGSSHCGAYSTGGV